MTKYYAYDEPAEDGSNVQTILTEQEAIQMAKDAHPNMSYINDEEALWDFRIVHWAYHCDKHGEPI